MPRDTIPHRVLTMAAERPSTIAYQAKANGRWQPTTWETYVEQMRGAARATIRLRRPGGGGVGGRGAGWPAALGPGRRPAGTYPTCSPEEIQYIIHHSESLLVLVENAEQLAKVKAK